MEKSNRPTSELWREAVLLTSASVGVRRSTARARIDDFENRQQKLDEAGAYETRGISGRARQAAKPLAVGRAAGIVRLHASCTRGQRG